MYKHEHIALSPLSFTLPQSLTTYHTISPPHTSPLHHHDVYHTTSGPYRRVAVVRSYSSDNQDTITEPDKSSVMTTTIEEVLSGSVSSFNGDYLVEGFIRP